MSRIKFVVFLSLFVTFSAFSQTIPLGTPAVDDYLRRAQLSGELNPNLSFTVRPTMPFSVDTISAENFNNLFLPMSLSSERSKNRNGLHILPVSLVQRYNHHPSYAINDGAMIPGKGYQSLISAGVFAKLGPLSVQLKPEYIYAANSDFNEFRSHLGSTDLPVRFGQNPYSKLLWGQSSLRITFDPISIGISNENLWWGPGIKNSLLMSNNAPGFKHLTLNTTKPIKTPIGSFETQIVAGKLEESGFSNVRNEDWRYLSGMVLTYQPRWFPGIFVGFTRGFQIYSKDNDGSFGDYFPVFQAFQKKNTNEDAKARDQVTSVFARWLFKESKAELYFEYGKNDHAYDLRDFLMAPEHSRAYTLGMNKLISYGGKKDEFIQVAFELTHLEQSIDRIIREAGEWYTHGQIIHGYTNRGEVLGAGIGPGGNFQSLSLSWVKNLKQIGLQFERYEHNGDLANTYGLGQWVDFSAAANGTWDHKNFLLNAKLQAIQSVNYQWLSGPYGSPNKNAFHINAQLGVMYRF
jgi:hypothetical protein